MAGRFGGRICGTGFGGRVGRGGEFDGGEDFQTEKSAAGVEIGEQGVVENLFGLGNSTDSETDVDRLEPTVLAPAGGQFEVFDPTSHTLGRPHLPIGRHVERR